MLAMLFACRTSLGFQSQSLGSVSGALGVELGFSQMQIGTLIGLFMLPGLVLALPAGALGRRWPDRAIVGAGLLLLAGGAALAALAEGFGLLALARGIAGVGFVFSTIYMTKMVTDWFAGRELATALGLLVMSWPFGIAMSQTGHVWIASHLGWRAAFGSAGLACAAAAFAVVLAYRPPGPPRPAQAGGPIGLPRRELVLTLLAALVWGLFNAGYVVYLSFAPRVLVAGGLGETQAASIISLASWVMIFSGAACGQIADRTGWRDPLLYGCLGVGVLALLLLRQTGWAIGLSLVFGLIGAAPAGIIMALTGEAMAPQRRAFGMGVFFSAFFVLVALAPPAAGWLFDRFADPYLPIVFSAALFVSAGLVNALFRQVQRRGAA